MQTEYIKYGIEEDPIFNEEGDEIGSESFWLINKVFVPTAKRGQGIARKLMLDAIVDMKLKRSDLEIKLWCEAQDDETDQEKLAEFYESLGFSETGNGAEMVLN